MVRVVGSRKQETQVNPGTTCLKWAARQVLWVVASLCFDHVGLAVSEATTAQAEYVLSSSASPGFIDWYIDY